MPELKEGSIVHSKDEKEVAKKIERAISDAVKADGHEFDGKVEISMIGDESLISAGTVYFHPKEQDYVEIIQTAVDRFAEINAFPSSLIAVTPLD